jgi:hypothetical protein
MLWRHIGGLEVHLHSFLTWALDGGECVIRTSKTHFFLIYFSNYPLHVSNRLTIHHQEAVYCICSICFFFMHLRWLAASKIRVFNFILRPFYLWKNNTKFVAELGMYSTAVSNNSRQMDGSIMLTYLIFHGEFQLSYQKISYITEIGMFALNTSRCHWIKKS